VRATLGKPLRELFEKEVPRRLPGYARVRGHQSQSGDRLFRRELAPAFFGFLRVVPYIQRDEFTVEVGWGPAPTPSDRHASGPVEAAGLEHGYFRLPRLWQPGGGIPWWVVLPNRAWEETVAEFADPRLPPIQEIQRLTEPDAVSHYLDRALAGPTAEELDAAVQRIPALVAEALDLWQAHADGWLRARAAAVGGA
jgi:hypothetical protein